MSNFSTFAFRTIRKIKTGNQPNPTPTPKGIPDWSASPFHGTPNSHLLWDETRYNFEVIRYATPELGIPLDKRITWTPPFGIPSPFVTLFEKKNPFPPPIIWITFEFIQSFNEIAGESLSTKIPNGGKKGKKKIFSKQNQTASDPHIWCV